MFKRFRLLFVLILIVALLPVQSVQAGGGKGGGGGTAPVLTPPWTVPTLPSNCQLGTDSSGSQTLICKPQVGSNPPLIPVLVIFAHGYVNPYFPAKQIPWDQYLYSFTQTVTNPDGTTATQTVTKTPYDLVTAKGYYFATSSYRANGLVVQDAIQDLLLLETKAKEQINRENLFGFLAKVVLVGVSEGGLITALSIERNASSYDGGLAMCGPVGNFQRQINYWGDFRALYDVFDKVAPPAGGSGYNSGIIPYKSTAINIPFPLITDWYGNTNSIKTNLAAQVTSPAYLERTQDLLNLAGAPYDSAAIDPLLVQKSIQDTVTGLLDYNIFATMNGQQMLGGNPFANSRTVYPASSTYGNINSIVARYTSSKTAINNVKKYETTGILSKPLVLLHNEGDPIVPAWHAAAYQAKKSGSGSLDVNVVPTYGHCNFTEAEIMGAFDLLAGHITALGMASAQQELSPEDFAIYKQQMVEKGLLAPEQ